MMGAAGGTTPCPDDEALIAVCTEGGAPSLRASGALAGGYHLAFTDDAELFANAVARARRRVVPVIVESGGLAPLLAGSEERPPLVLVPPALASGLAELPRTAGLAYERFIFPSDLSDATLRPIVTAVAEATLDLVRVTLLRHPVVRRHECLCRAFEKACDPGEHPIVKVEPVAAAALCTVRGIEQAWTGVRGCHPSAPTLKRVLTGIGTVRYVGKWSSKEFWAWTDVADWAQVSYPTLEAHLTAWSSVKPGDFALHDVPGVLVELDERLFHTLG